MPVFLLQTDEGEVLSEIEFAVFVLKIFAEMATNVCEYFFYFVSDIEGIDVDLVEESKLDLDWCLDNVLNKLLLVL